MDQAPADEQVPFPESGLLQSAEPEVRATRIKATGYDTRHQRTRSLLIKAHQIDLRLKEPLSPGA